jgi:hypothetical protein
MIARYTLFWFILAVVAIGNGALREFTYAKHVSELSAHQISTLTAIILTGLVIGLIFRYWPLGSARDAWLVGVIWFGLTVAFEFIFGHYVAGHAWARLFHDYNLLAGRLWAIFLMWLVVAPYVFFRFFHPQA